MNVGQPVTSCTIFLYYFTLFYIFLPLRLPSFFLNCGKINKSFVFCGEQDNNVFNSPSLSCRINATTCYLKVPLIPDVSNNHKNTDLDCDGFTLRLF